MSDKLYSPFPYMPICMSHILHGMICESACLIVLNSLREIVIYYNEQGATLEDSLSDYHLAIREFLDQ
jgi:hypothetical protein